MTTTPMTIERARAIVEQEREISYERGEGNGIDGEKALRCAEWLLEEVSRLRSLIGEIALEYNAGGYVVAQIPRCAWVEMQAAVEGA